MTYPPLKPHRPDPYFDRVEEADIWRTSQKGRALIYGLVVAGLGMIGLACVAGAKLCGL